MNELQIFLTITLLMSCATMLAYLIWYVTFQTPKDVSARALLTFAGFYDAIMAEEKAKREGDDE